MANQEYASLDTTQLVTQAQAAYEEGRTRECLALTKALVKADPGNIEAQALEAAIRSDIQQDLHDARGLLEHSGTPDEKRKYCKAAEIILVKTLHLDPENEEAKILLQSAKSLSGAHPPRKHEEDIPFVAAALPERKKEKKKFKLKLPFVMIALSIAGGGFFLRLQSRPSNPNGLAVDVAATAPSTRPNIELPLPEVPQSSPVETAALAMPVPAAQAPVAVALPPVVNVPPPVETGKLVVSSPTVAEIYLGERYLGSTPATLQLPAGRHSLEYRRGDLRTVMSHEIRSNETTTASVTFQVTVQINARPWAQVFLDGSTRRPLGQTPLGGVTVPIGGVLLFENPNFTAKSYRITEKDAAIQVDFQ